MSVLAALQHKLQGAGAAREGESALLRAIAAGSVPALHAALAACPASIFAHSKDGEGVWHAAVQGGQDAVLAAVRDAVAAALAAQSGHERRRLQAAAVGNAVNQAVSQVLAAAAVVPLPAALAVPMGDSLDIDAQTRDGTTPLMAAAKAGRGAMCEALLGWGADAWRGDADGATALHHAAWQGHAGCLAVLLRHAEAAELGWAAAGGGASGGRGRLVEVATTTGLTALHFAAWRGQCDAVVQLVNAGAALAAASCADTMGVLAANAGATPLHLAAMRGQLGVVRLLLRANRRLLALGAADARLAAAADAASGLLSDVRGAADRYGKTPCRIAWDLQRWV